MSTARSIALDVLQEVFFDDAYSHLALSNALDNANNLSDRDKGLTTEIVYGTLARKRTIDALLSKFVNRSVDGLDEPVLLALRMAVYQLLFLDRIPEHAAVDEAVELTKEHCGRGAGGFTNGVLRSLLRKKKSWKVWEDVDPKEQPVRHLGLRHSLPDWIAELIIDEFGFDKAMSVAQAFNARPPLYFRVLDESSDRPEGLQAVDAVPGAYRAEMMTDEMQKALYDCTVVVQDLGSQLVGHFCEPQKATNILDGCAGLGGKTLHLAGLAPDDAMVVAVEPHGSKLKELHKTLAKTSLTDKVDTIEAKLEDLPEEDEKFDLVLVDAPCSGLGVIRRHPETRWRRTLKDIEGRATLQTALLDDAVKHVAAGGLLVYSVCSFTNAEGPKRVQKFLADHDDFSQEPISGDGPIDWSKFTDDAGNIKLNPADHDADAFFAARLRRE